MQDNYIKTKISNKKDIFRGKEEFKYPSLMQETIKNKINYISTIEKEEIINNVSNKENKEIWLESADILIDSLETQLNLVKENKLYYE